MATRDVLPDDPRITVNRRVFAVPDRVLTGYEIAALVGVPADNAVVEQEVAGELMALGLCEKVDVAEGARFLVTRQFIMGGCSDGFLT